VIQSKLKTFQLNNLRNVHYYGLGIDPVLDEYESLIIHRLISTAVIDALYPLEDDKLNAPDVFMTIDQKDVKPLEVSALIETLAEMGLTKLSDPIEVENISINQLRNVHYYGLGIDPVLDEYESLIIHRLISTAVIDALYPGAEINDAPDVFMTIDQKDVKPLEVSALIETLAEMGLTKLSDPIEVENISINQLRNVHYYGLGIDPVLDEYESLIIHRLISTAVIDALYPGAEINDAPDVFMTVDQKDVKPLEVSALIETLAEMGLTKLSDPIEVQNISINQLRNVHYYGLGIDPVLDEYESLIIHRLISTAVIDALYPTADDKLNAPDVFMTIDQKDVKPLEVSALIETLAEMGLTKLSDPIEIDNISIEKLQNLHYLGLGTDPVDDIYDSLIVHRLLSEAMIASLDTPSIAKMDLSPLDLKADEVQGVIEAMLVIGGNDDTKTLLDLTPINNSDLNAGVLQDLIDINKFIVYRMISNGIIAGTIDTDESYAVLGDDNFDPEDINADIKIAEMQHVVDSMVILGVTSILTVAGDITIETLENLTPEEVTILVEDDTNGPNTIIYYLFQV
jgi:hypothetical protein